MTWRVSNWFPFELFPLCGKAWGGAPDAAESVRCNNDEAEAGPAAPNEATFPKCSETTRSNPRPMSDGKGLIRLSRSEGRCVSDGCAEGLRDGFEEADGVRSSHERSLSLAAANSGIPKPHSKNAAVSLEGGGDGMVDGDPGAWGIASALVTVAFRVLAL